MLASSSKTSIKDGSMDRETQIFIYYSISRFKHLYMPYIYYLSYTILTPLIEITLWHIIT